MRLISGRMLEALHHCLLVLRALLLPRQLLRGKHKRKQQKPKKVEQVRTSEAQSSIIQNSAVLYLVLPLQRVHRAASTQLLRGHGLPRRISCHLVTPDRTCDPSPLKRTQNT